METGFSARMRQSLAGMVDAVMSPERLGLLFADRRSLTYAVLVHVVFGLVFLVSFNWVSAPEPTPQVNIVEATVVDEAKVQAEVDKLKKADAARKRQEDARQKELERKAREAEAARRQEEKRLAEVKKQKDEESRKLAEQKKQKEAEAKKLAEQKKAEEAHLAELAEKKKAEEARLAELEKQRKEQAEQLKKQQEEQQRREAEQALQAQLDAEQKQLAAERERQAQTVVDRYVEIIKQKVTRNWLKPPTAGSGLKCLVHVTLIPGGEVAKVNIDKGSGDPLFDRSVETAVRKASPLPLPPDPAMFDRFRELTFIFNPEE